ncbi:hypothetical protein F5Y18DRAFT_347308 [Xylariaceae sp. FL1019]|nr:hypothetical protein F5Y18DRAFT_347308 [Xylariaceae sp. FL1019]
MRGWRTWLYHRPGHYDQAGITIVWYRVSCSTLGVMTMPAKSGLGGGRWGLEMELLATDEQPGEMSDVGAPVPAPANALRAARGGGAVRPSSQGRSRKQQSRGCPVSIEPSANSQSSLGSRVVFAISPAATPLLARRRRCVVMVELERGRGFRPPGPPSTSQRPLSTKQPWGSMGLVLPWALTPANRRALFIAAGGQYACASCMPPLEPEQDSR